MKDLVHRILSIWAILLLTGTGSATWTSAEAAQGTGYDTKTVQSARRAASINRPASLTPIGNIAFISAGESHTCAVTGSGGVKCWGGNGYGQLGDGSTVYRTTPVDVHGLTIGIKAVAAGGRHTCALTTSGGVKCWGDNEGGQLGDNSVVARYTPGDVVGLSSGALFIDSGRYHTCAQVSGAVLCWGGNGDGEIGDGTATNRLTPVSVIGLPSEISAISIGRYHSCTLSAGGGLKCWGGNWNGQLGDGTGITQLTPVDVIGLTSGVKAVTANGWHSCAVTMAGGVKCWGLNGSGQLGNGNKNTRLSPVNVTGLSSGVAAISAGKQHTCALTSSGTVKCWGDNQYGQLGDGTKTTRTTQADVPNLFNVVAVSAGENHTCALMNYGGVKCWGANESGQLGDGTTTMRLTPVDVVQETLNSPPAINEGDTISLEVSEDSSVSQVLQAADADNDPLTWSIFKQAEHGSASATGTGTSITVSYTPFSNYYGSDNFVVRVSDGQGGTDAITVRVTIKPTNDAPVITEGVSTKITMCGGSSPAPYKFTLHATDADNDTLTWSILKSASRGAAVAKGTGTSIGGSYTPEVNYSGSDGFDVQVSDGHGGVDRITIFVVVQQAQNCQVTQYLPGIGKFPCYEGSREIEPNNKPEIATGPIQFNKEYQGYPNDDRDYFYFLLNSPANIKVSLINHSGRGVQLLLFYQNINSLVVRDFSPPYSIDLPAGSAPLGLYYIYIYTESGTNSDALYTLKVNLY